MPTTIKVVTAAPVAKPEAKSLTLTTNWVTLIEPANYEVQEQQFDGSTEIQPGVAEISSVLMLANKTAAGRKASVRITRASGAVSVIFSDVAIEPNDVLLVPVNGQFLLNDSGVLNGGGDKLEVKADLVSAIDATISYTVGQAEANDVA